MEGRGHRRICFAMRSRLQPASLQHSPCVSRGCTACSTRQAPTIFLRSAGSGQVRQVRCSRAKTKSGKDAGRAPRWLRTHVAKQIKDAGRALKRAHTFVREQSARPRTQICAATCALFISASMLLSASSAIAAECAGDECQGPPPAPAEVIPGTAVAEGPPNPPVHYPKVRKHHPKKHLRHQHRAHRARRPQARDFKRYP
jgi:hypothetical protein